MTFIVEFSKPTILRRPDDTAICSRIFSVRRSFLKSNDSQNLEYSRIRSLYFMRDSFSQKHRQIITFYGRTRHTHLGNKSVSEGVFSEFAQILNCSENSVLRCDNNTSQALYEKVIICRISKLYFSISLVNICTL